SARTTPTAGCASWPATTTTSWSRSPAACSRPKRCTPAWSPGGGRADDPRWFNRIFRASKRLFSLVQGSRGAAGRRVGAGLLCRPRRPPGGNQVPDDSPSPRPPQGPAGELLLLLLQGGHPQVDRLGAPVLELDRLDLLGLDALHVEVVRDDAAAGLHLL